MSIEERRRKLALTLGMMSAESTCLSHAVVDVAPVKNPELVSTHVGDAFILLEEWGIWTASTTMVEGVGTPKDKPPMFIDDDTAMFIDRELALLRKRDADGRFNFGVLRAVYVFRKSYTDVSRDHGLNRAAIKPIIDKYAYWLDARLVSCSAEISANIKCILNLRSQ